MKPIISAIPVVCLLSGFVTAPALIQKMVKVQTVSLWAPADIKIDGRALEWKGKFAANNKANNMAYTISNDEKNLYLIVHTAAFHTINKVYVGGITFSVTAVGKKKGADKVSVTYPIIGSVINNGDYLRAHIAYKNLAGDTIANRKSINELMLLKNKEFSSTYNTLQVNGIKDVDEQVISIYNTEGIKVKAVFDHKFDYTYELAIPLKYLASALNGTDKFRYVIKLNGEDRDGHNPYPADPVGRNGKLNMDQLYTENPTDFGGVCTLAKK